MLAEQTYQSLQKRLKKQTRLWNVSDIQIWLQEINMEVLYPRFKKLSVDGSCLQELEQKDLREQIGIKSQFSIDKIMKWIKNGFKEYNNYLRQSRQMRRTTHQIFQKSYKKQYPPSKQDYRNTQQSSIIRTHKLKNKFINQDQISDQFSTNKSQQSKYLHKKLFIYDKNTKRSVQVQQSIFSIGSSDHSGLQLFNVDEDDIQQNIIDQSHAIVNRARSGELYVMDMASIHGTFMKITEIYKFSSSIQFFVGQFRFLAEVFNDDLVISSKKLGIKLSVKQYENIYTPYFGSEHLEISQKRLNNTWKKLCSVQKRQGMFLLIPYNDEQGVFVKLATKIPYRIQDATQIKIGENILVFNFFREDYQLGYNQSLSYSNFNNFQDCSSFLGTNYLYSEQNGFLQPKKYQSYQKIKQGSSFTLDNSQKTSKDQDFTQKSQICIICYQKQRDCLLLECRHFVMCLQCVKSVFSCPICRAPIQEIQRVYLHF